MEKIFWEFYSQCYDAIASLSSYQAMLHDIVSQLPEVNPLRTLDVCCGTGNAVPVLIGQKKISEYIGIDFSTGMLRRANSKYGHLSNVTFRQTDVGRGLPFPDKSFDVLLSINSLYIMSDPSFVVKEFHRVVKENGLIIVSTPAKKAAILPHLSHHIIKHGALSLILKLMPLLLVSMFNLAIIKKQKIGKYNFFTKEELKVLFQSGNIQPTYAGQNWLIKKQFIS